MEAACATFGGEIVVWQIGAWKERRLEPLCRAPILGIGFSSLGRELLVAAEGQVAVVDAAIGRQQASLPVATPVSAFAISSDGRRLLLGEESGELTLWSVEQRVPLMALGRHEGRVGCVALAPNGSHAVSWGWEGQLNLWDLRVPLTFPAGR